MTSSIARLMLVLWCASPTVLLAQARDPHEVQPERPTVATHAGTVAPGWLEIEAGGERDRYDDGTHGVGVPIVIKLGLASNAQLSVLAPATRPPGASAIGVGDLAVGVKWRLADDVPILGRFAVLPSVKLPTGSTASGAGTGTVDASLLLISSHDLGPVSLDVNVGYTRRSGSDASAPRAATLWTISFGGPAAGPVGWTGELYGYPGTSGSAGQVPVVAVLFGPTFSVRPWLVLDTGVIVPVTGLQPRAVYVGGVWNIGRVWRSHEP